MPRACELNLKVNDVIGDGKNVGIYDGSVVHLALSVKVSGTYDKVVRCAELPGDDWNLLSAAPQCQWVEVKLEEVDIESTLRVRLDGGSEFPAIATEGGRIAWWTKSGECHSSGWEDGVSIEAVYRLDNAPELPSPPAKEPSQLDKMRTQITDELCNIVPASCLADRVTAIMGFVESAALIKE